MSKKPAPILPWTSVDDRVDDADIASIKALVAGNASADQQKRGLDLIVTRLCGTYDMSFRPGGDEGDRATTFAEGKRFVGNQIVRMMKMSFKK